MKKRLNPTILIGGLAAGIACISLTGCATPGGDYHTSYKKAGNGFPAVYNYYKGGDFVDPQAVLRVSKGETKDEVRQLLGVPQYDEGFFNVHTWNYAFNLYYNDHSNYLTCQYQVHFDKNMQVDNTRWKDPQCPTLLVPVQIQNKHIILSGDVLFDFDKSQLSFEGQRALDKVVQEVNTEYASPSIVIRGYTDRLGSDAHNQPLSQQRANTVAAYLSAHGLMANGVQAQGMGSAGQVKACDGYPYGNELKNCLAPNRRVDIEINGKEKAPAERHITYENSNVTSSATTAGQQNTNAISR